MMRNKFLCLIGLLVLLLVCSSCNRVEYINFQSEITETRNMFTENGKLIQYCTNKNLQLLNEIESYEEISNITGWPLELSIYFCKEAKRRNIDINKGLAVANVETGGTYRFDLVNINDNGTNDGGIFQINSGTYPSIVAALKKEGYNFSSWDREDPYFGISAGLYWLSYLKNTYQYKTPEELLTAYNRGHNGMLKLVSRSGSAASSYSRKVLNKMQK